MTELILTRGLPGSGKSTYARKWVSEDSDNRVRVCRDDIRFSLFGKYTGVDENIVSKVEVATVKAGLAAGKSVIVDAMHLKSAYIRKWEEIHPVTLVEFPVSLEECIFRDESREIRGQRHVGEKVIRKIAKRYHIPEDGRLPKYEPRPIETVEHKPYVPGEKLAYSFDIDGTLAIMQGRSPYDPTRYHEDAPDRALQDILWRLQDSVVPGMDVAFIGLSGRSEDYRAETEEWLEGWGMKLDALFMRPSGDNRNDAIVKSELVDKHISNVYDVIAHFDDRRRVVDALRAKNMKVLQVAPGDF